MQFMFYLSSLLHAVVLSCRKRNRRKAKRLNDLSDADDDDDTDEYHASECVPLTRLPSPSLRTFLHASLFVQG